MNKQIEAAKFRATRTHYRQSPPKGLGAEVKRQDALSDARIKARKVPSVRQKIMSDIESRAVFLAGGLPGKRYSMGTAKHLHILRIHAIDSRDCREYPPSSRQRATHGVTSVRITPAEFRAANVVGGVLTIYKSRKAMLQPRKIEKVSWFQAVNERQYAEIVRIEGYINAAGFHHADRRAVEENLRIRSEMQARSKRRTVGLKDAIKAGLCLPGIQNFCEKAQIDIDKKYKLSYILELARQHGVYKFAARIG